MIGMKVSGIEQLLARLRNTADKVPETARKTMHRGADRIVELARLQSPVDLHNLEESIRKEVAYEDGRRGRLRIDIAVGGIVNGVNVDQYAVKVHEAYEISVAPNGPGPGTLAKMRANPGVIIGSKFLERALEKERAKLTRDMIAAITEVLR